VSYLLLSRGRALRALAAVTLGRGSNSGSSQLGLCNVWQRSGLQWGNAGPERAKGKETGRAYRLPIELCRVAVLPVEREESGKNEKGQEAHPVDAGVFTDMQIGLDHS
jgi:hypothetical protein